MFLGKKTKITGDDLLFTIKARQSEGI